MKGPISLFSYRGLKKMWLESDRLNLNLESAY